MEIIKNLGLTLPKQTTRTGKVASPEGLSSKHQFSGANKLVVSFRDGSSTLDIQTPPGKGNSLNSLDTSINYPGKLPATCWPSICITVLHGNVFF